MKFVPSVIPDWKRVLLLSYSFWAQVLGLFVLIVPELRFILTGRDTNPVLLWWLGVGLLAFGLIGRLVQQTGSALHEVLRILAVTVIVFLLAILLAREVVAAPANEAETLAIALPLIKQFEGKENQAYSDPVDILTICWGHTRGVREGMRKTDEECEELLREDAAIHRDGLHRFFEPRAIELWLPPTRDAAYTSLAFNCGVRAIGRSTSVARLNRGDISRACEAMTWWNKAGQRVLRGLVRRRQAERALCLRGLD